MSFEKYGILAKVYIFLHFSFSHISSLMKYISDYTKESVNGVFYLTFNVLENT